jgi:hypothetical protein
MEAVGLASSPPGAAATPAGQAHSPWSASADASARMLKLAWRGDRFPAVFGPMHAVRGGNLLLSAGRAWRTKLHGAGWIPDCTDRKGLHADGIRGRRSNWSIGHVTGTP